jgi:hypothetical protein
MSLKNSTRIVFLHLEKHPNSSKQTPSGSPVQTHVLICEQTAGSALCFGPQKA